MIGGAYLNSQQDKMAKFPEATDGFQPKKVYAADQAEIWKDTMNVLEKTK